MPPKRKRTLTGQRESRANKKRCSAQSSVVDISSDESEVNDNQATSTWRSAQMDLQCNSESEQINHDSELERPTVSSCLISPHSIGNKSLRKGKHHFFAVREEFVEKSIDAYSIGPFTFQCRHCHALHFQGEKVGDHFSDCCRNGKVIIEGQQTLQPVHHYLRMLLTGNDDDCKNFQQHIRSYNSALAFASIGANVQIPAGRGIYSFKVQGQFYHKVGNLFPENGKKPSYGQLYVIDTEQATKERVQQPANSGCLSSVMSELHWLMLQLNPFVRLFKTLHEKTLEEYSASSNQGRQAMTVRLTFTKVAGKDQHRYNAPTAHEIAAVYVGENGEPPGNVDFEVYPREGGLQQIRIISPNLDPMCYPVFFPYGELGWHTELKHVPGDRFLKRNNLTMLEFFGYRLAVRSEFSAIHNGKKLFQQLIVDWCLRWEGTRLDFIRRNQTDLRIELYQGLADHLQRKAEERNLRLGKMFILPSTFIGSPRYMHQCFQDAMAIVRKTGKPDFFITFTCDPAWHAIKDNLQHNQQAVDRPDLVARVFAQQHKELMDDLTKKCILGRPVAWLFVIEFQKRGLPHTHILLTVCDEDKPRGPDAINRIVIAEIPDKEKSPRLFSVIETKMTHGPCGELNPSCVCMENGECQKKFPKKYLQETIENDKGYPAYRRRQDGRTVARKVGRDIIELDNRWIVPYNPYLCLKYGAHINIEIATTIKSIKYLFKYVYKGPDAATIEITVGDQEKGSLQYDEIKTFVDGRYLSSIEAAWRLFENSLHQQSHTVYRLAVHLPLQQNVMFREGEEVEAFERAGRKDTTLTAWFKLNQATEEARKYLYPDIPDHFVFTQSTSKWTNRQRSRQIVSRMYTTSPKEGEKYYLRMLLLHVRGAKSYEDLRTVDGHICDTFKQAAIRRNLLKDDQEWERCLQEATEFHMPGQQRQLFVTICAFCEVKSVRELWITFKEHLSEDFAYRDGPEYSEDSALEDIETNLRLQGLTLEGLGLPAPIHRSSNTHSDEMVFDQAEQAGYGESHYSTLNNEQRAIVDEIVRAVYVENPVQTAFFVDGPGGTGKTRLFETLMYILRGKGDTVLPVAFSGIAATLLSGGRTVHSRFGLPVPLLDNSTSSIKPNSKQASILRQTRLIIWDEAPMAPSYAFNIVDRLLRDLTGVDKVFGGKVILLGGDFRQVLPVLKCGTRAATVGLSIKHTPLWGQIRKFFLTQNMRAGPDEKEFADWLLNLGDGKLPGNADFGSDSFQIPEQCVSNNIVEDTYGRTINIADLDFYKDKAILCPKNSDTYIINNMVLQLLPGQSTTYCSVDSVVSDDPEEEVYPIEFLNKQNVSALPPHKLELKVGAIVMLIRNLNTRKGLCNGTRMVILSLKNNVIEAKVLTGEAIGTIVLIPRIDLEPTDTGLPFILKRRQFPIRLAFAMTINKAQGQTLGKVGLFLPNPVFSHGQAYVAFSRARKLSDIRVQILDTRQHGKKGNKIYTSNIVFKEIFF